MKKNDRTSVRLTEEEMELWDRTCLVSGLSMSDLIRYGVSLIYLHGEEVAIAMLRNVPRTRRGKRARHARLAPDKNADT